MLQPHSTGLKDEFSWKFKKNDTDTILAKECSSSWWPLRPCLHLSKTLKLSLKGRLSTILSEVIQQEIVLGEQFESLVDLLPALWNSGSPTVSTLEDTNWKHLHFLHCCSTETRDCHHVVFKSNQKFNWKILCPLHLNCGPCQTRNIFTTKSSLDLSHMKPELCRRYCQDPMLKHGV